MNYFTSRVTVLVCVAGLFAWVFFDALFASAMFCFRDAAHYYYPLFQLIQEEWAAGRVPLWNPYENLGQPLAGNPTASVFYPGKLIFALPLSYPWAYKTYTLGHVLLAAWAAYRLARHFGASIEAAGCCAISYAFSGNVLYQYCNVVFLVGAAWLPLALLAADRMLTEGPGVGGEGRGRVAWAVLFGSVLAMMTLGGDPQMAYNAGMLAALYAVLLWWKTGPLSLWERVRVRARRGQSAIARNLHPGPLPKGEGILRFRPALLALAAVVALVLSAIQVLPSVEFTSRSTRRPAPIADRLLARLEPGTHHQQSYEFSVGPWRLAEYVWPNVSGRQFPVNRRWLEALPAEGRIWTPSLYMGILPFVLALSALRLRRGDTRARWFSWSVVLAVAGSLGWYGLGWLLRELHLDSGVGAPFGGLYWLMTLLLPGYARFRYPAKLLVIAALGLSVLAARGWDEAFAGRWQGVRRWLLVLCGVSVLLAIAALAVSPFWAGWLSGVEGDMLFGPLDAAGALGDLLGCFVQTALLCGVFWCLLRKRGPDPFFRRVVLVLVALDLAVANGWMIVCVPGRLWQEPSKMAAELSRLPEGRVYRHPIWMRPRWRRTGSPQRLADAVRWDRDTLWPKYNLADRIAVTEVQGAMMLAEYEQFLRRHQGGTRLASYAILPGGKVLPGGRPVPADVPDASLWQNPNHLPRAWLANERTPAILRRTDEETCHVVYCDPLRVEIESGLSRPGKVVLCDQFYPGWKLEVDGEPAVITRVCEVMRGVSLPAGRHRLSYCYRPASFFWGAIVSGLGWIALGLWAARDWRCFLRRRLQFATPESQCRKYAQSGK